MEENKIHIDRKMPTDADIDKHRDFQQLLKTYMEHHPVHPPQATVVHPLRKYALYAAAAVLILSVGGIWMFQNTQTKDAGIPQTAQTTNAEDTLVKNGTDTQVEVPQVAVTPTTTSAPKTTPAIEKPSTTAAAPHVAEVTPPPTQERALPPATNAFTAPITPQLPTGKVIKLAVDVADYPELAYYKNISWEYVGDSEKDNPWKNDVFGKQNKWSHVEISKEEGFYLISLVRKDGTKTQIPVKPVFEKGKDYEAAGKIYKEFMQQRAPK